MRLLTWCIFGFYPSHFGCKTDLIGVMLPLARLVVEDVLRHQFPTLASDKRQGLQDEVDFFVRRKPV